MNGINVQTSLHEEVVKILTESGETVKLVAYREKIINKKMKPMSQINGVDPNNAGKPSDPNNKVCEGPLSILITHKNEIYTDFL